MSVKLAVSGATGRMGHTLLELASKDSRFEIVGALETVNHPMMGKPLAEVLPSLGSKIKAPLRPVLPEITPKPDVLIDLATLTAAVRAALGPRYAAIMGTDANVVRALIDAAQACGEHLWELPLVAEYRTDIESSVADIKNTGEGTAGTIIAALFLREFVGTVPWAHIDFSSTVMTDKPLPCHPRGATGFGVRTLLHYLCALGG